MAMIGIGWELGIFGEARCCLKWDLRFIGGLVLMYVALGDRAVLSCPHQMVLVYCGSYVNTWTFCCDCYYVVYLDLSLAVEKKNEQRRYSIQTSISTLTTY